MATDLVIEGFNSSIHRLSPVCYSFSGMLQIEYQFISQLRCRIPPVGYADLWSASHDAMPESELTLILGIQYSSVVGSHRGSRSGPRRAVIRRTNHELSKPTDPRRHLVNADPHSLGVLDLGLHCHVGFGVRSYIYPLLHVDSTSPAALGTTAKSTSTMRAKMGVPQLLVLAGGGSVLLRRLMPQHSSGLGADLVFLFLALALANFLSKVWIYQPLIGPLRHIPTPPGRNILLGETFRILRDPTGMPAREWIRTVPNQGMIRYSIWGQERLLVTSPEAFGEVLVKRNYDFVKPDHLRRTLSRLLGVGILLAEGDEHKRQRKTLMPAFAFRLVA